MIVTTAPLEGPLEDLDPRGQYWGIWGGCMMCC